MFKLSTVFVAALLTGAAYASPTVEKRSVCTPSGIDTTKKYFIQSNVDSKVWQAEDVTSDNFIFIDTQTKATNSNDQLWSVAVLSNGFAFESAGPSASVCADGDGGPLDSAACPNIASKQVPQLAQWAVTCATCASNGATGCQIQAITEGQCADFDDESDTTVVLNDCSTSEATQVWNLVAKA